MALPSAVAKLLWKSHSNSACERTNDVTSLHKWPREYDPKFLLFKKGLQIWTGLMKSSTFLLIFQFNVPHETLLHSGRLCFSACFVLLKANV